MPNQMLSKQKRTRQVSHCIPMATSSELLTTSGLPTSSSHRSSLPSPKPRPSAIRRDSPIAADGGFGPMPSSDDDASDGASSDGQEPHHTTAGKGLGEDFDDFEAQGDDDDFGDFDDGFEQSSTVPEPAAPELPSLPKSPFVSSNKYKWFLFEIRHIPPARSEGFRPANSRRHGLLTFSHPPASIILRCFLFHQHFIRSHGTTPPGSFPQHHILFACISFAAYRTPAVPFPYAALSIPLHSTHCISATFVTQLAPQPDSSLVPGLAGCSNRPG